MTRGSVLFLDTNVLLAATDRSRTEHGDCTSLLVEVGSAGCHLTCTPQILREYLVVATRPVEANGLGLASIDAQRNVQKFQSRVTVLDESTQVLRSLLGLVETHGLTGKRIHDASIVAAMTANRLHVLITSNGDDFRTVFEGTILSPTACLVELRRLASAPTPRR